MLVTLRGAQDGQERGLPLVEGDGSMAKNLATVRDFGRDMAKYCGLLK